MSRRILLALELAVLLVIGSGLKIRQWLTNSYLKRTIALRRP